MLRKRFFAFLQVLGCGFLGTAASIVSKNITVGFLTGAGILLILDWAQYSFKKRK